jgi:hypothetical protein
MYLNENWNALSFRRNTTSLKYSDYSMSESTSFSLKIAPQQPCQGYFCFTAVTLDKVEHAFKTATPPTGAEAL